MEKTTKCYRCGTVIPIDGKNGKAIIECPHCHGKMVLDKVSQKHLRMIRYIAVSVIMIIMILVMQSAAQTKNYVGFAVVLIILVFYSNYADKVCLWILKHTFGIGYEEYKPEETGKRKK